MYIDKNETLYQGDLQVGDREATEEEVKNYQTSKLLPLFKSGIQALLDEKARAKGYDDMVSACSYAGYENPFRVEGESFGIWRANVWTYGYEQLALIQMGAREMPTLEDFLAELPTMAV